MLLEQLTDYGEVSAGELLDSQCDRLDSSYARLARLCGLSQYQVSQVVAGNLQVKPHIAVALEKVTGIPAIDWLYVQARHQLRQYQEQKERDGQTENSRTREDSQRH